MGEGWVGAKMVVGERGVGWGCASEGGAVGGSVRVRCAGGES